VSTGGKKTGVFVDGQSAADVVAALGADGTGHVHFG
jgi:thiamine-monophosphate kinase